jgi:methylmalonyl-CoA mutase N-terminal domain/subunit
VVDPLAGSYFVEGLTDRIEKDSRALIEKIDSMGGSVRAIENGFQQREIQNAAFEYQKKIEEKKLIIVGVNEFESQEPPSEEVLKVKPELEVLQVRRLIKLKSARDNQAVTTSREKLKKAAQGSQNLIPFIIAAVCCYTTLGEISHTLREVFGEYKENVFL